METAPLSENAAARQNAKTERADVALLIGTLKGQKPFPLEKRRVSACEALASSSPQKRTSAGRLPAV
jgi:hypothetical protein